MNKASNFAVGDIVKILPTATERKYNSSLRPDSPRWVHPMEIDIGQTGVVISVYSDGNVHVRVGNSEEGWVWMPEDLKVVKYCSVTSKWRRKGCS